jgi:hypothetical protein
MKSILVVSLFYLSFSASANTTVSTETKQDVITERTVGTDRGKRARRAKRKNKRRKRKCKQFGRKVYAG